MGVGQSSGKLGAASFSVTPRLVLSPNSGSGGSTVTAEGYGFGPNEPVFLVWNNKWTWLGRPVANATGTFSGFTFTAPVGAPLGVNKVFGRGQMTDAIGGATFTVQ